MEKHQLNRMPPGEKARSSSASGRLETLQVPSILSELRSTAERKRQTSGPGFRAEKRADESSALRPAGSPPDRKQQPEWLLRELLKHHRPRHSTTPGDKAQLMTQLCHEADSTHSLQVLFHKEHQP
ncbi:hypothetical protein LDENG_00212990 [Lucifuga dentata]|nr:hypothetical protein LDENG_00212990 [Lucifuga dentata]